MDGSGRRRRGDGGTPEAFPQSAPAGFPLLATLSALNLVRRSRAGIRCLAPAKINLTLKILGRRRDGYHLLRSEMVPVSLCDELSFHPHPYRPSLLPLKLSWAGGRPLGRVPRGPKNLVVRAASELLKTLPPAARKKIPGVRIRLFKRIPVGGGLGGGSSDAAAALKGLVRFWGLRIPPGGLWKIARSLGADVPFFLSGRPALVEGIGEKIRPLPAGRLRALRRRGYVVAWPGFGCPTQKIYAAWDRRPGASRNDLEPAALRLYPKIAALKEACLQAGASAVWVTGSGSCVVAETAHPGQAGSLARRLRRSGVWARSVRVLIR